MNRKKNDEEKKSKVKFELTDVSQAEYNLLNEIIKEYFTDLINAKFQIIFYNKLKKSRGKIVFAFIKKASRVEKFFSKEIIGGEGYDYIVFLDKGIWENIEKDDKIRLMRHELRHCFVNSEKDDSYFLIGHDLEDFIAEVELNKDDIRWGQRVAEIAVSVYEKED